MAGPLLVDADWSRGQIRDAPRQALPEGSLYNSVDFLLHQPGLAQKRGGSSYAGPAFGTGTYASCVAYAEFPGDPKLVGVDENGHVYTVTAGATTSVGVFGSTHGHIDTPKFRTGGGKNLLIFTNDDNSSPKTYDGTNLATPSGSWPAGRYAAVYKGRLVLGNTDANPSRLYFSPIPDITTTWDTTSSWLDTDYPITALAALQNVIVVFSQRRTQRITGTTPPPGTDFDLSPVGTIGCTDARSVLVYEGQVIFANPRGLFSTNGSSFTNITRLAGCEKYWQSLFTGYYSQTWSIATGVFRSFIVVSIINDSAALVDCLMFNIARSSWWRLANIKARMFASSVGIADELYYADRAAPRITSLSGMFSPAAGNKNDADGSAVLPVLETRLLGAGPTLKHFGHGHVSMDMQDAASDNPVLAVSVAPGLEAPTFTAVAESPLAESDGNRRSRFTVGKVAQGVTVRFQQTNASAKTELYAVELETRGLPVQAGGQ